jgi:predicted dehydrogenase
VIPSTCVNSGERSLSDHVLEVTEVVKEVEECRKSGEKVISFLHLSLESWLRHLRQNINKGKIYKSFNISFM